VQQISKSYRNGEETTPVLKDLDLEVAKGEMVMIMGPSGSGKTTLMNSIGGVEMPDQGSITLDGLSVTSLTSKQLNQYRREKVGMVFQFYNLIPTLTARENVMLALEGRRLPRREVRERAQGQLELVGLGDRTERFPQELSAGEQQRVALARALVKGPALVLADEPTGNLDEASESLVLDLLIKVKKEIGTTFVVVSHNPRLKGHMDRCYELRHGRLSAI